MPSISEKTAILKHVIENIPYVANYVVKYEPVTSRHNLWKDGMPIAYIDVLIQLESQWHGVGTISIDGMRFSYESYYPTLEIDDAERCYFLISLSDPDYLHILNKNVKDSIESFFRVCNIRKEIFK